VTRAQLRERYALLREQRAAEDAARREEMRARADQREAERVARYAAAITEEQLMALRMLASSTRLVEREFSADAIADAPARQLASRRLAEFRQDFSCAGSPWYVRLTERGRALLAHLRAGGARRTA